MSARNADQETVLELFARHYAEKFGSDRCAEERVSAQLRTSAESVALVLAVVFDPSDTPPTSDE